MLLSEVRRVEPGSVINIWTQEESRMWAMAIKTSSREKAVGFQEMGTLRRDSCGEEFFIGHQPAWANEWVAEQQAKWLEKVLAEEHERDKNIRTGSNYPTSGRCSEGQNLQGEGAERE